MTQSAARRASSRATPARKTPPAPASQTPAPSPGGTAGTALGPTSRRSSGSAAAKDQPLKEDIRFLGRLLGDVLREQEGAAAFETVETIRQTAVRFRRDGDRQAEQELDRLLKTLSRDQTTSVVRAFNYFSHLANIAEDQHHNRRRRVHALAGSSPQPGSLLRALLSAADEGLSGDALRRFFDAALIVPVLTAHPTEVQRKSILDAQREIARLLAERDAPLTVRERERNVTLLRAHVTKLWQTRMLRTTRLMVADEIENALSYYQTTFLREIPALYRELEEDVATVFPRRGARGEPAPLPAFFQMGSWIGGDRDGNPFVTAQTLRHAAQRQASVILTWYLDEIHALGAELSMSTLLVDVSADLLALAERSPDHSEHRADEPYRRALIGVYARLAATCRELTGEDAGRHAVGPAPAYTRAEELRADLQIVIDSLAAHHGEALADARLASLARAIDVFGFHLASIDLRQVSDVHEATVAELLRVAGVEGAYAALSEADKRTRLLRELQQPRLLTLPFHTYSETTASELDIFRAAREVRALRQPHRAQLHHLAHRDAVGPAGSDAAAEGGGHVPPRHQRQRRRGPGCDGDPAVRDHRRLAQRPADHGRAARPARLRCRAGRAGQRAGSDARLFGFQQGRRLPDLQLGTVQSRAGAGGAVRAPRRAPAPVPRRGGTVGAAAARPTRPSCRSRRAR